MPREKGAGRELRGLNTGVTRTRLRIGPKGERMRRRLRTCALLQRASLRTHKRAHFRNFATPKSYAEPSAIWFAKQQRCQIRKWPPVFIGAEYANFWHFTNCGRRQILLRNRLFVFGIFEDFWLISLEGSPVRRLPGNCVTQPKCSIFCPRSWELHGRKKSAFKKEWTFREFWSVWREPHCEDDNLIPKCE